MNELSIEKVIILQMSKILVAMKVTLCVKSTLIYCQERATCRSFFIFLSPVTREWSEPVKRTNDKFIFESIQIFRSQSRNRKSCPTSNKRTRSGLNPSLPWPRIAVKVVAVRARRFKNGARVFSHELEKKEKKREKGKKISIQTDGERGVRRKITSLY